MLVGFEKLDLFIFAEYKAITVRVDDFIRTLIYVKWLSRDLPWDARRFMSEAIPSLSLAWEQHYSFASHRSA